MNIYTTGVWASDGRALCISCFSKINANHLGGLTSQGNITNVSGPGLCCAACGARLTDDEVPTGVNLHVHTPKRR